MENSNVVGRLRVADHGTLEKPGYVVLGRVTPELLQLLGMSPVGKNSALLNIVECLGQVSLEYAGEPENSGYGRTFDNVWDNRPGTIATKEEMDRYRETHQNASE